MIFLPMQQIEPKMDACMLLRVLMSLEVSINNPCLCRSVSCFIFVLVLTAKVEELSATDQRSAININMLHCCSILMLNKTDCHRCIQNYLIAVATATPCPDPASRRSCIHLSIFVSAYCAVVRDGQRRFKTGK